MSLFSQSVRVGKGREQMSEWKKLHDRELVLAGTVMAIIYRPGRDGDFAIYSGCRYQWSCPRQKRGGSHFVRAG